MQVEEGATAPVMEQPIVDTEAMTEAALSDALLPVHLPNVGSDMMPDGVDAASSRLSSRRRPLRSRPARR
jgi:hypothetical protein